MASPPGTWQIGAGDPSTGGEVWVTIFYNVTTLQIEDRTPPIGGQQCALICDNRTSRVCPLSYFGPTGSQTVNAPIGVTRLRANVLNQQGFVTRDDLQGMSLAVPAA